MEGMFRLYATSKRSRSSVSSTAACSSTPLNSSRRASRTSSAVSAGSSAVVDDIDAALALSARALPGVLPHAAQFSKARRIRLYRNGDTFYEGMIVVLAPDHFRTFDSLLTFINKSPLADPSVLKKVSSPAALFTACITVIIIIIIIIITLTDVCQKVFCFAVELLLTFDIRPLIFQTAESPPPSRITDTSLTGHFACWTVRLLFGHLAYKADFYNSKRPPARPSVRPTCEPRLKGLKY